MKLYLPNGSTGFWNERNEWQSTGSQMGRRNIIPDHPFDQKLSIQRVKLYDSAYDKGGAYWGGPENLYCAFAYLPSQISIMAQFSAIAFCRASCRAKAKQIVRKLIPSAKFYH